MKNNKNKNFTKKYIKILHIGTLVKKTRNKIEHDERKSEERR